MRFIVFMHLVWLAATWCAVSRVSAQEKTTPSFVAMDQPSAELLRRLFPSARLVVLISREDQHDEELNRRALSLRDVERVFYRGDQSSLVSKLYRERLSVQGVLVTDVAAYLPPRARSWRANTESRLDRAFRERHGQTPAAKSAAVQTWVNLSD